MKKRNWGKRIKQLISVLNKLDWYKVLDLLIKLFSLFK
ncbi:hypothetical protein SAMN04487885_106112 [Clostridium cadaveris]|uniref:Uncharacterized protein n=1 Tax=Clostridium cadaveris TaxID=1529 RepID=A0A1I2KT00_9CLOT|nr:hypothetical protein SAMN04487885_106112 [Clostridium cadaveris]